MRHELSLVLSWNSFQFARNVVIPIVTSHLETGSRLVHKCVHTAGKTGQNCSVCNILRTTENCLRLSPTQFTPPTRRDSFVLLAVWTMHNIYTFTTSHIRKYRAATLSKYATICIFLLPIQIHNTHILVRGRYSLLSMSISPCTMFVNYC